MAKDNQDIGVHFAGDEETDKIREWWKKNGSAIIIGLIVGIGSVAGYQGWSLYQTSQAEGASDLYQDMLRNLNDGVELQVRADASQLVSEYGSTAYGDAALLMLAKLDVEAGEIEKASDHLRQIIEHSKDSTIKHIARLRLVTLTLELGDLNQADKMLKVQAPEAFSSRYDELRGDLFLARGDLGKARNAYQSALRRAAAGSVTAQILGRKLNRVSGIDDR